MKPDPYFRAVVQAGGKHLGTVGGSYVVIVPSAEDVGGMYSCPLVPLVRWKV